MALIILTIIVFAGGFIAVLYFLMALLSMLQNMRASKTSPDKYAQDATPPKTIGPAVAEALCKRAKILLLNQRFEAALADCKRAIDINPSHAEAHTLWELALEKKMPPVPAAEPSEPPPEISPPAAEAEPAKKKVKKAVKKIKRRKKIVAKPVPVKKPKEEPVTPLEEAAPDKEVILEEKPPETITPQPEPEESKEVAVPLEPGPEIAAVEPEPKPEPAIELKAEAEVKPVTEPEAAAEITEEKKIIQEPFPEEKITVREEPPVELEAEKPEPAIELEAEAEVEPAAVEPEVSEKVEEVPAARKPLPGEEEGPLIPEDQLAAPKPPRESLLEEVDHEKLREFEKGEAEAGDEEWTRFADKTGPELAESKINMNELPDGAVGLKDTLTDLRQAEAYNLQGETNITKNLFNNAIKDFSRALEINPNFVDSLINRGSAYAQLGRFNDALMDFNHALKFEKKDAELYNKRGEIYLQNNMYDQSIKDFTAAIVLNPVFSDAYLNRGRAYSEKGMPDEAMTDFNQAIKTDSDHSFSFVDRAAPGVHAEMEKTENREEAAKFNKLGLTDLGKKKFKEALNHFTEAINHASIDAEGYINRGRAHIMLNQIDEAMADFNQAVLFDPLNASIYYWRAQGWKAKKDSFNLKEDLKLACEMGHSAACLEYKKIKQTK